MTGKILSFYYELSLDLHDLDCSGFTNEIEQVQFSDCDRITVEEIDASEGYILFLISSEEMTSTFPIGVICSKINEWVPKWIEKRRMSQLQERISQLQESEEQE